MSWNDGRDLQYGSRPIITVPVQLVGITTMQQIHEK